MPSLFCGLISPQKIHISKIAQHGSQFHAYPISALNNLPFLSYKRFKNVIIYNILTLVSQLHFLKGFGGLKIRIFVCKDEIVYLKLQRRQKNYTNIKLKVIYRSYLFQ